VNRRQALIWLGGVGTLVVGVPVGWSGYTALRFPSEKTAKGAYLRIALAFGNGRTRDSFPYLEGEAKHALCTIHEYRRKSLETIRSSFVEPERSKWEAEYREEGDAVDPPEVWARMAKERGWDARMRRDLSGIASIEHVGKRATVVTVRGTRYPFREADDGIWGLTMFTAELVAHKERSARDFELIKRAAADYEAASSEK
jgi:hypothetical protein